MVIKTSRLVKTDETTSKAAGDGPHRTLYRLEPVASLAETAIRYDSSEAAVNHPQFYHRYELYKHV